MSAAEESVRRARDDLDAAVDRGRRARALANESAERFRTQAKEVPAPGTDSDIGVNEAQKLQEQTPSDGSDLDFSQAQIMH